MYKLLFFGLAMFGIAALGSTTLASSELLVRCPDYSAVYRIEDDGKRHAFPNERIFFSWYADFTNVDEISCSDLATYSLGQSVTYQAGTRLIKMPSVPTVYAVEPDGVLRAVPSESYALAVWGSLWAQRVDDLSEAFFPAYDVGEPLADDELPEGTIVRDGDRITSVSNDSEVDMTDEFLETFAIERPDLSTVEPTPDDESESIEILTYEGAYNGPLYDTVAQIGDGMDFDTDDYLGDVARNNIQHVIGMFSVESDDPEEYEFMDTLFAEAPGVFVPFLSPGFGEEEVLPMLGQEYADFYEEIIDFTEGNYGADTVQGLGEIQQYGFNQPSDDESMTLLVDIAEARSLHIMFHPNAGDTEAVENLVALYPDTTFLLHMFPEDFDDDRSDIIDLMTQYDNLYFSIDADHTLFDDSVDWGLIYYYEDDATDEAVEGFVSRVDRRMDVLINDAVTRYEPLVLAHPDKVMWGTEAGPGYIFEPEAYDKLIEYSRYFIAEFDEDIQEDLAFNNAYRIFGTGK